MVEELTVLGMKVGDLATWFGAAGSIAAVITALRLARTADRRHDREAEARGRVIASFLFTDVGMLQKQAEEAIKHAELCKTFPDSRAYAALHAVHQIVSGIDDSKYENNLDKLAALPASHGEFLAAVPDMKRVLVSMSVIPALGQSPHLAHAQAEDLLKQLRAMKENADAFMKDFMPIFAT